MSADDDLLPEFDDAVVRAMAKWPDVPRCFGWLALDRRGAWRLRDEVIRHPRAAAFLSRHYRADENGCWHVQNGPQRVYVDLEYTPWVYRYDPAQGFTTHTGIDAGAPERVLLDEEGNVLLVTRLGVGVLDDRDLAAVSEMLSFDADGHLPSALTWNDIRIPVTAVRRAEVAATFGFVDAPAD